jgi:hypothetical protein
MEGWGPITPIERPKPTTPAVRRGHRRRGRNIGMHVFNMPVEDRQINYQLSKVGRRG